MSKVVITKNMSQSERLEAIRKASAKFNAKMNRNIKVVDYTTPDKDRVDDSVNINAWTDSEKYVDEYYGERARAQSAYENEWN